MALDPVLTGALKALGPYLDQVVVVGGWVPYLYAACERASASSVLLRTRDVDLAVPRTVPRLAKSLDQQFEEAGFACEFRSLGTPPVTAYVGRHEGAEVEIELITNAQGDSEGVRIVQHGLSAQELRYVSVLLDNKWDVPLQELTEGELTGHVWVPTPAAFVFHKALAHKRRTDALKSEKDLYYIFFVLDAFGAWRAWMRAEMPKLAASSPAWFARCLQDLAAVFEDPTSAGVDALVHQRPATAFPGMNAEQFRQYAWSVMQELLGMMRAGRPP